ASGGHNSTGGRFATMLLLLAKSDRARRPPRFPGALQSYCKRQADRPLWHRAFGLSLLEFSQVSRNSDHGSDYLPWLLPPIYAADRRASFPRAVARSTAAARRGRGGPAPGGDPDGRRGDRPSQP